MNHDHSVTQMLHNLREGQDVSQAQALIWEKFFHRLKGLAEKRMDDRMRRVVDGEDIAIEALHDFFEQMGKDAFPHLTDRESLWPLLAKITSRKAINQYKKDTAQKRGGGDVRGESVFIAPDDMGSARGIEQIERELTPEFADEMFLGFADVLAELKKHDEKFYEVAVLRLKGHSAAEIAEQLGYKNAKTPDRIIKQVRIIWKSFYGGLATFSVIEGSQIQFETNLNEEPTFIGRQRAGEPSPYWTGVGDQDGEAGRRIVVAHNTQKSVSRKHAKIQIVDENQIVITNPSRKSKIMVNSEIVLGPDASWTTTNNCSLQLSDTAVMRICLT